MFVWEFITIIYMLWLFNSYAVYAFIWTVVQLYPFIVITVMQFTNIHLVHETLKYSFSSWNPLSLYLFDYSIL